MILYKRKEIPSVGGDEWNLFCVKYCRSNKILKLFGLAIEISTSKLATSYLSEKFDSTRFSGETSIIELSSKISVIYICSLR